MTEVGLSEELGMRVNTIAQDSAGYIYFGGFLGLKKYDGNSIKHFAALYNDSTSISTGEVYNMQFDEGGDLWLAMRYGGLNRFSKKDEKFKKYHLPLLPDGVENSCHGLLIDKKDDIWIGSGQMRLYQVDKAADTLIAHFPSWLTVDISKRFIINTIIQDVNNEDLLWLSVTDYLSKEAPLDENYRGYGVVSFNKKTKKFIAHPNQGRLMYQRDDGTLISTYLLNHLIEWSPKTNFHNLIKIKSEKNPDRDFLSRKIITINDKLWVNNVSQIFEYSKNAPPRLIYESPEGTPYIYTMFKDKDDNIWIGTAQGAMVYNPKFNKIKSFSLSTFGDFQRVYPGRISYDEVNNCILLAHDKGESKNRLYRIFLDPSKESDFIMRNNTVYGLAALDSILYESYRDGLKMTNLSDGLSYQNKMIDDTPFPWHWNMNINKQGTLFILGGWELYWKNQTSASFQSIHIDSISNALDPKFQKAFNGVVISIQNEVLLFSNAIYAIDLNNGKGRKITIDKSFNPKNDEIFDVKVDSKGFVWAAGQDYLGKFEREKDHLKLVDRYTISEGLLMTQVTELFIDHSDRVWCFMQNGVCAIDPENREVRTYGLKDGLRQLFNDPRQVIQLKDKRIVSVNSNGLILFHPDELWEAKGVESTFVTIDEFTADGVSVDHQKLMSEQAVELPYGNKSINISFQGLHFPSAKGLQYSYRLLGIDDKWIDIGNNRKVVLTSLSSGTYTFQVKVGPPEATSIVSSITLKVATPFYASWWFILLAIFSLLGLTYSLYHLRIKQLKKETQDQIAVDKKIAELELSALRAQMNPHFMFNSLNSIKNFILTSKPLEASEYLSNFAHLIRLILQNSKENTISIEEEIETLELYIELEQMRFDKAFTFIIVNKEDIELDQIKIPPMILQPYIENSIWHGFMLKNGERRLELRFERSNKGFIECIIDDNGIGRAAANKAKDHSMQRYKSMGMGITKERVEIINKMSKVGIKIKIIDKVDDNLEPLGTQVRIKIPNSFQLETFS